ncbi:BTB/POZ domain-containing protein 2-like [Mercenaria mercenaria]|uniref:BTB/POZ domain-containing protein 2-like n=1 Tax=Mercenaria mercenaria TaxID=6596 RepID=UPI00234EA854|nr:BTB/POZ domain-containing protein 2-like [Mercenaria mercenaria]
MELAFQEQYEKTMPLAWQHNKDLGDCMVELYDKRLWTDVKLRCKDHDENERIHAHKIVLAARSPVFQAMFFGACTNGKDEVQLDNTESKILDLFLRYIYSDTVALTEENASAVLEIAHYYQVTNLVQFCADYLATLITPVNACEILTLAMFYKVTTLRDACCTIIDRNADEILKSEGFLELTEECLTYILKGDTFYADEDNIFIKSEEWSKRKIEEISQEKIGRDIRKTLGASFFYLRLPTMTFEILMKCTRKKGYLTFEEYEDIVEFINKFPASSVKSNSCVARLQREETMTLNGEDGKTNVYDNIDTKFEISVSRDVKLTHFVVREICKYLKYNKLLYTDENCPDISFKKDVFFAQNKNKPLKFKYNWFETIDVKELKAAHGEDLSDKLDTVISGTFKVTGRRSKTILRGKSKRVLKLHEEESTAGNGEPLEEVCQEEEEGEEDADGAVYSKNEELIFEQDFQLQSADATCRRIDLRQPLTLTKDASPYIIETTMHYGCTSGVKMKTRCSNTKTARSKFGQIQVQDIAGQFAGIKSIGFENISNR